MTRLFQRLPIQLLLLTALQTTVLLGQGGVRPPFRDIPSSIEAVGQANVKVTPDRATIRISVQSRKETAAAAVRDNAYRQTEVINSLRKEGLSDKDITTAGYTVEPNYRYQPNREPVLIGYVVTNTVIADVHDIKRVGSIIDATIASGANMISSLEFYASNTGVARNQAIAKAVESARGEADAAAKAAGGSLGEVLEISIGGEYPLPPRPIMARAMAASDAMAGTPISPGEQTLMVTVSTRWRFIQK